VEVDLYSLKHLHTFALPASCNAVSTFNSVESLKKIVSSLDNTSYIVLGEGSNTVFTQDYSAHVLLNKLLGIVKTEDQNNYYLSVGAGENWHSLVMFCMKNNIGGFENLALIPGSVGAAPIQNIGAYGVEVERFITSVEFLDTNKLSLDQLGHDECQFAYRDSVFKRQDLNERIITKVNFTLPKVYSLETSYGPLASIQNPTAHSIYHQVMNTRNEKLPNVNELGNAGSFFKNPVISMSDFSILQNKYPKIPFYKQANKAHEDDSELAIKIPAAWLIDQLGFKGSRQGNIGCHVHQALVLVNLGGGKGTDLLILARKIRDSVRDKFGITLENEVRLMGEKGLITL